MEPINPELRRSILERVPSASPEEIDEYEQLLAERFTKDPSELRPQPEALAIDHAGTRLQALYEKLILPLRR